jgi:glycosyltransferase involved in cell wall biosynthesis
VHSNTLAVFGGALWARWRRVPHLWHVHEIILRPRPATLAFPLLVRLLADRVIANSSGTAAWLLQRQPALGARCAVISNGLPPPPPRSAAAAAAFRAGIGAQPQQLVVALVGRINGGKGHDVVLAAAEELQRRGALAQFRFVFAGGPPPGQPHLQEQLERAIAASPARAQFQLLPFADDIWSLWYGSDIAVVPSTAPESFGLVAAEAMAAGLPVIASAQGGLLDIVVHGDTGLLVAPGDVAQLVEALLCLTDADVRARLGRAGHIRQQREFAMEEQFRKWISEYGALAKRKGGMGYATS